MNDFTKGAEASGTFACPVCGFSSPHYHDYAAVQEKRIFRSLEIKRRNRILQFLGKPTIEEDVMKELEP